MAKRAENEGFRMFDDFVCEAIHDPSTPLANPAKQGRNEGISVGAELILDASQESEAESKGSSLQSTAAVDVIVRGVVQGGRVVPDTPLPEGARVEVRLVGPPPEVSPEMQGEFEAWGQASDRALDLTDRPAPGGGADPAR
jgi:hypothetical protein